MAPLKPGEIQLLAQTLHHLEGARLQGVMSSKRDLVLEFFMDGSSYFLWFDDSTLRPTLTFWPTQLPFAPRKSSLPLSLFLKAHFVGRRLRNVAFYPDYGRMIRLYFDEELSLEFRLFAHGQNVVAMTQEKSISLHKPKALQKVSFSADAEEVLRSVEDFSHDWLISRRAKDPLLKKKQDKGQDPQLIFEKKKKKLQRALGQIREEVDRKESLPWKSLGVWLQDHQTFQGLPSQWEAFVDRTKSVHWNVDHVFQKAKETEKKLIGTKKRIQSLEQQLKDYEEKGVSILKELTPSKEVAKRELKGSVKARRLQLNDLQVLCGKNAKDNMTLLRQAKPWDLWFHIKDWPSSHAIVMRAKNRKLSPQEQNQVIQWFFSQNFGKRLHQERGNKYEVIVAECRHVKAIKGDRVGRVTYQKEKVIRAQVQA